MRRSSHPPSVCNRTCQPDIAAACANRYGGRSRHNLPPCKKSKLNTNPLRELSALRCVTVFHVEKSNRESDMLTVAVCPAPTNTLSNPLRFLGAQFAAAGNVRYSCGTCAAKGVLSRNLHLFYIQSHLIPGDCAVVEYLERHGYNWIVEPISRK